MKVLTAVVAAIAVTIAGVSAYQGPQNYTTVILTATAVTEIVQEYVTVVPNATIFTYGNQVVEATAGETVTITDCPCEVTRPVSVVSTVVCTTGCTTTPTTPTTPTATASTCTKTRAAPVPTAPVPTAPVVGTGTGVPHTTPTTVSPPIATAGAARLTGIGMAAVLGLVALAL